MKTVDLMHTSAYDFELPEKNIAQTPLSNRNESKLLVYKRSDKTVEHTTFKHIVSYLNAGDCLVLNQTRVIPARLFGKKETGAKIEVMLTKQIDDKSWVALTRPGRKVQVGTKLFFSDDLSGECIEVLEDGQRLYRFTSNGPLIDVISRIGEMPLPPYIHEKLTDNERYQTVFSDINQAKSIAAPTAGLHFTEELINQAKEKGVHIAYVTLHVGLGTFLPMSTDSVLSHKMHAESFEIDAVNAEIINAAKKNGGRIIPVGTTSLRTIETVASSGGGIVKELEGDTSIFIYPGYEFAITDALITNFHLPKSTLLMLVSALITREQAIDIYKEAIACDYRFFSFGDAMLIL